MGVCLEDGEKINSDAASGIIITKKIETKTLISMLVVRSSQMSDAGIYVCRSSNRDAAMLNVVVINGNEHGRRSVGGQGDMSPLLFEVEGTPCVLSPPYFLGVDIVCYLKNSLF